MDLFSDIVAAIQSDLNIDSNSTLFDTGTIKLNANRAYRKVSAYHRWPPLRDAQKTSTVAGQEDYDYPQNWQPDSIWKVRIAGKDMGDATTLKDYYNEVEINFPSGNKYIWTTQNDRILVQYNGAAPITNGDNDIELWGFNYPPKMVADADVTVFSYNHPEINEAIVLEALSICRIKGGEQPVRLLRYIQGALLLSIEAQGILDKTWAMIQQEQAKIDKTQAQWNVSDMFATGINRVNSKRYNIGNF